MNSTPIEQKTIVGNRGGWAIRRTGKFPGGPAVQTPAGPVAEVRLSQ